MTLPTYLMHCPAAHVPITSSGS